jgi:phage terminase small subunit
MENRKLSPKQRAFVEAYAGNATEAARIAGYKGTYFTLATVGKENLKKPQIWVAIQARGKDEADSRIATRAERQAFWTDVVRGVVTDSGGNGEADIIIRPDMKDRLRAAELLGKSEGDFIERKEISGPEGGPIQNRQEIISSILDEIDGHTIEVSADD